MVKDRAIRDSAIDSPSNFHQNERYPRSAAILDNFWWSLSPKHIFDDFCARLANFPTP